MVEVVVDTREPKDVLNWLCKLKVTSIPKKLDAGDYFIPGKFTFLVERKTATDFANSLKDKRIWNQIMKMKASNADNLAVVIEGSIAAISKFTQWNEVAICSVILSIRYKFGIDVFFTSNPRYTALFLYSMAKLAQTEKKKRKRSLIVKKKVETEEEKVLRVVESFPKIGPSTAVDLLSHFNTLQNIANAEVRQLMQVPRIGKKTAKEIYNIFRYQYEV